MCLKKVYSVQLEESLISALKEYCKQNRIKQGGLLEICIGKVIGWSKDGSPLA
jgi:hypothetical protein